MHRNDCSTYLARALREGRPGMEGVSKELINAYFGWCLKELAHDMQLHYAGLDRPARRTLARVTMYL